MVNPEIYEKAVEAYDYGSTDFLGFCLICGTEHSGVEPDARNYTCNECGRNEVFGIDEIILMG